MIGQQISHFESTIMTRNREIEGKLRKLLPISEKLINRTKDTQVETSIVYQNCIESLQLIGELKTLLNNKPIKSRWKQTQIDFLNI